MDNRFTPGCVIVFIYNEGQIICPMKIPSTAKFRPVGIENSIRSVGCPGTAWCMAAVQPSKRGKNVFQKAHVPSVKPKEATPQRHLGAIAIPNVEVLQQSFLRYQGEK